MRQFASRARLIETILLAGSSILLYHLGLGIALFLIPLQVLAARWGMVSVSAAGGGTFAVLVVEAAVRFLTAGRTEAAAVELGLGLMIAFFMIAGLLIVNLPSLRRFRALTRLLGAALFTGLLAVPLIVLVPRLTGFQTSMRGTFTEFSSLLRSLSPIPEAGSMGSFFAHFFSAEALMKLFEQVFLRSFLVLYFALLAFQWWAGSAAASRTLPAAGKGFVVKLSAFRLESVYLWPLIASGALVLLDVTLGIWVLGYAAWNVGLVFMFLFGVQGLGIIKFLFEKYGLPRFLWAALVFALGMLLVYPQYPQLNLFFMIAIPALGISENWIRLRIPRDVRAEE